MSAMISIINTIAYNTFAETIRNKILYNILLFAVVIIGLSVSFGEWSVFARTQVMTDFGLATMSIAGLLLAIFIGVGLLGKELGSKTVYLMASKPIHRSTIIIGKFIGLTFTLLLNLLIMSFFFMVVLKLMGGGLRLSLLYAIVLIGCEMVLIVSVALLFSTFTTTTLAAIMTIAFYIAGHLNDLIGISNFSRSDSLEVMLLKIIYYLIPNLEHFNIRTEVIYNISLPGYYVGYSVLYGLSYTVLLLGISTIIFSRKDL
ncbi:MAG: ABC transporter permease [Chitinivibrionales bacterium]|nr:ABC transporter permease [Chitinivibrionales bacterium]